MQQELLLPGSCAPKKVTLLWSNGGLTIVNPPKFVEEALKYTEKDIQQIYLERANETTGVMERVQRVDKKTGKLVDIITGSKVTRKVRRAYVVVQEKKPHVILAWQGLVDRVRKALDDRNYPYTFEDKRREFLPKPKLGLMHGFRFNQKQLLLDFLAKDRSGILCAPTRYGKTVEIINTLRAYIDVKTVVTAPGKDLLRQLVVELQEALPGRDVVLMGAGSKRRFMGDDITVCSMDSLHKLDMDTVHLVLIDEPHAAVSEARLEDFMKFRNARILAYGATPTGRFDGRDIIIEGLIGPALVTRTYQEAVAEGAICRLCVIMMRYPYVVSTKVPNKSRNMSYRTMLHMNRKVAELVQQLCNNVIPHTHQTLIFIQNEKQADFLAAHLTHNGVVVAMDKTLTNKQRVDVTAAMKADEIKRCISSNIFSTGVTFSELRCLIVAAGGGGSITAVQKPGRLAEVRPGKKCGVFFDFMPYCVLPEATTACEWAVMRDAEARLAVYREKGYEVEFADSIPEAMMKFVQKGGV